MANKQACTGGDINVLIGHFKDFISQEFKSNLPVKQWMLAQVSQDIQRMKDDPTIVTVDALTQKYQDAKKAAEAMLKQFQAQKKQTLPAAHHFSQPNTPNRKPANEAEPLKSARKLRRS